MELNETPDANGVTRETCSVCGGSGDHNIGAFYGGKVRLEPARCARCQGSGVIVRRMTVDPSLNVIDSDGVQQVFAISPFGASESREERIARLEAIGSIDPNCPGCREFYEHERLSPFAPSHRPGSMCQSGKRPHCTCDGCF